MKLAFYAIHYKWMDLQFFYNLTTCWLSINNVWHCICYIPLDCQKSKHKGDIKDVDKITGYSWNFSNSFPSTSKERKGKGHPGYFQRRKTKGRLDLFTPYSRKKEPPIPFRQFLQSRNKKLKRDQISVWPFQRFIMIGEMYAQVIGDGML